MKELIKEIVEGVVGAADELLEKDDRNLVDQGQLIAYAEALSIIRDAYSGYDLAEIGLDFDIDAKYLV